MQGPTSPRSTPHALKMPILQVSGLSNEAVRIRRSESLMAAHEHTIVNPIAFQRTNCSANFTERQPTTTGGGRQRLVTMNCCKE
jgi:hypothetical protein